jgi:hypothetical protein
VTARTVTCCHQNASIPAFFFFNLFRFCLSFVHAFGAITLTSLSAALLLLSIAESPPMFASSGLFSALPCPFQPHCHRESYCIYSHQPFTIPTDSTSSSISSSIASIRSKPHRSTSTGGSQSSQEIQNLSLSNLLSSTHSDSSTSGTKAGSSTSPSSSSSLTTALFHLRYLPAPLC